MQTLLQTNNAPLTSSDKAKSTQQFNLDTLPKAMVTTPSVSDVFGTGQMNQQEIESSKHDDFAARTSEQAHAMDGYFRAKKDQVQNSVFSNESTYPDHNTTGGKAESALKGGYAFIGTIMTGLLGAKLTGQQLDGGRLFEAASNAAINTYGTDMNRSFRQSQREDLRNEGYTDSSIEDFIYNGDRNVLTARQEENGQSNKFAQQGAKTRVFTGKDSPAGVDISWEGPGTYERSFDPNTGTYGTYYLTKKADGDKQYKKSDLKEGEFFNEETKQMERWLYDPSDGSKKKLMSSVQQDQESKGKGKDDFVMPPTTGSRSQSVIETIEKFSPEQLEAVTDAGYSFDAGRAIKQRTGSAMVDANVNAAALEGKLFLEGIGQMKGLGALSNAEGSRVSNAAAGMFLVQEDGNVIIKPGISKEKLMETLNDLHKTSTGMLAVEKATLEKGSQLTPEEEAKAYYEAQSNWKSPFDKKEAEGELTDEQLVEKYIL